MSKKHVNKKLNPVPAVIQVLCRATNVYQKPGEPIQWFLVRLIEKTSQLSTEAWAHFSTNTRDYYNEAARRLNLCARIPEKWPAKPLELVEKQPKITKKCLKFAGEALVAAIEDAQRRTSRTQSPTVKRRLTNRIAGYKKALWDITNATE